MFAIYIISSPATLSIFSPFLAPLPRFLAPLPVRSLLALSLSVRRRSAPRLGNSCLNAQTKRQIKGTAGRARTARRMGKTREKKERERGKEGGRRERATFIIIVRARVALPRLAVSFLQHLAQPEINSRANTVVVVIALNACTRRARSTVISSPVPRMHAEFPFRTYARPLILKN